jgi:hypothetical protein
VLCHCVEVTCRVESFDELTRLVQPADSSSSRVELDSPSILEDGSLGLSRKISDEFGSESSWISTNSVAVRESSREQC